MATVSSIAILFARYLHRHIAQH